MSRQLKCRGGLYALPAQAGINPALTKPRFLKNGRNVETMINAGFGKRNITEF